MLLDVGSFQKMQQRCDSGAQNSNMNTLMKPIQFICGNLEFLEFSKILSHMYHIFLRKLIKITVSIIFVCS